jgi:hypothetical protein
MDAECCETNKLEVFDSFLIVMEKSNSYVIIFNVYLIFAPQLPSGTSAVMLRLEREIIKPS